MDSRRSRQYDLSRVSYSPLLDTLVTGQSYTLSFYVSVAEVSTHYSDDIGAWLTKNIPTQKRLIAEVPQVRHPQGNLISDMEQWTEIKGSFVAEGGEQYIVIGNFLDDETMTREKIQGQEGLGPTVYYYVDQVSLSPEDCESVIYSFPLRDTSICPGETIPVGDEGEKVKLLANGTSIAIEKEIVEEGQYEIVVKEGMCQWKDTITVQIDKFPHSTFLQQDILLCEGNQISLVGDSMAIAYQWENGANTLSRTISDPGQYFVRSIFTCYSVEQSFDVRTDNCDCTAFIPNVFSPNGDEIHDQFTVDFPQQTQQATLTIRDRWGKQLFHSDQIDAAWDGTYEGDPLATGLYLYEVNMSCQFTTEEWQHAQFRGTFTLLR